MHGVNDSSSSSRPWLVQKYGGASLGKLLETICADIIPSHRRDHNLVVVCSALSGAAKAAGGTTGLLLECAAHAEAGLPAQAQLNRAVDAVRDGHVRLLEGHLVNANGTRSDLCRDVLNAARDAVVGECEGLRRFLLAAQIVGELSPRARDRVVSLGERLACRLVAALLRSKGVPAETVVLDDVVEAVFGGAAAADQRAVFAGLGPCFYHLVADEIAKRVRRACGEGDGDGAFVVPVVTGFFGLVPGSLLRSVGRGYSDLCAAMCAVGVKAAELQIWKEVDGIFTADPRRVPSARLLPTVTPEEAAELTYCGSEVVHPMTVDQVRRAGIPLRLKNVFNPTGPGTLVYPTETPSPPLTPPETKVEAAEDVNPSSLPTIDFMVGNGYRGAQRERRRRRPTAVTVKDDVLLVNVAANRNVKSQGFLAAVFERLEEARVRTDLVTTSERNVSLAFQHVEDGSCRYQRLRAELEKFGKVTITENMSIVTVVGHKMRNMVGISSEITSALASVKINIFMVSQGASEISVSLIVRAEDAVLALNVIHSKVLRIPTHRERGNDPIKGAEARRGDAVLPREPPARCASPQPLTYTPRSVALLRQRSLATTARRVCGSGHLDDEEAHGRVERWVKRRRQT
ncbi:aspartate kinase [Colletotrichum zoysiae]|uniref:Aspartate kinase FUB3 n=1 Tax=Colletotrichum zoysiae TaxID=1216348 RepID=A0AAD9M3N5_9PEZI|nr:aspartate kinase [Colletotrichum zoysiae]